MRRLLLPTTFAWALLLVGLVSSPARCSDGWPAYYPPTWSLHPFGLAGSWSGSIPPVPYFAIHPPVYYGRRVSMPYGNSPVTRPPRPVTEVLPAPDESARGRSVDRQSALQREGRTPGRPPLHTKRPTVVAWDSVPSWSGQRPNLQLRSLASLTLACLGGFWLVLRRLGSPGSVFAAAVNRDVNLHRNVGQQVKSGQDIDLVA